MADRFFHRVGLGQVPHGLDQQAFAIDVARVWGSFAAFIT